MYAALCSAITSQVSCGPAGVLRLGSLTAAARAGTSTFCMSKSCLPCFCARAGMGAANTNAVTSEHSQREVMFVPLG